MTNIFIPSQSSKNFAINDLVEFMSGLEVLTGKVIFISHPEQSHAYGVGNGWLRIQTEAGNTFMRNAECVKKI